MPEGVMILWRYIETRFQLHGMCRSVCRFQGDDLHQDQERWLLPEGSLPPARVHLPKEKNRLRQLLKIE